MWTGPAQLYVLLALGDGPSHGLGIADDIAQFTENSVLLGPGTLYRCLRELDETGLIVRVASPDKANPHRKYYDLTDEGIGALGDAEAELQRVAATAAARVGRLSPGAI
jgi:PadR family transcriptional regulator